MVKVYTADISKLPDPLECPNIMKALEEGRQEKMIRCKHAETRKQSLGAGLLLLHALREEGILSAGESLNDKVQIGVHGKPEIKGICFNLSHSAEMVACAVSSMPVGCDIEKIKEEPEKVADKFLTEKEKEYLMEFAGEDRDREFFRLWTMKESYIKMTGEGLSVPLNHLELQLNAEKKMCRDGEIQNCIFREYEIPGYILTICAKENDFSGKVIRQEWNGVL